MSHVQPPHPKTGRRAIAAVLLIVASAVLQRSATSQWGSATDPMGSRVEVSPIGITKTESSGARQLCRWWPVSGEASLCRADVNAGLAMDRLRMAYPLLQVGFWSAVIALFLVVLRTPRRRAVRLAVTLFAGACGLTGALCVVVYAPAALAILQGLVISFRLSGAWLAWLGTGAVLASGLLQLTDD